MIVTLYLIGILITFFIIFIKNAGSNSYFNKNDLIFFGMIIVFWPFALALWIAIFILFITIAIVEKIHILLKNLLKKKK